ncbi:LysM peptidoglycan-binding domain-containing protein [Marinobacterium jannaschii]|uniref:LysM peptidoglycan-binding domain-containing protein n=1 Tax=Marinobacterium jannaschii TaxID=64970 RepID=UPI00047FBE9C|nr:LysM domain-containing protein [Marinobacterium jannaschii]
MKKLLCGLLTGWLLLAEPAAAEVRKDVLALREDHPQEYVVVKGDTLWHISGRFLQTPWRWPELWDINSQIDNPHLIYPGDVIQLVWVNGKPKLKLKRGMVKLMPKARVTSLQQAIPAIPLRDIIAFLQENRVLEDDLYTRSPYVLGANNERIIAGAGDRVYARGELLDESPRQTIYRAAGEYYDPETEEFLGYELLKIADVVVADKKADVLTLDVRRSHKEIRILDRVVPTEEERIQSLFHPAPAPEKSEAKVLSVLGGVNDGGQFNVVAFNLGQREGLEPGHVFSIYRRGERIKDPVTRELITLPEERSGLMMVFRSFEKVSYGLVLHSSNVVSVGDSLREP